MDLVIIPILILSLCLIFFAWRIYLIRHTLKLLKNIDLLKGLWTKRRMLLESVDTTKFQNNETWLTIEKELYISFNGEKARIKSEEKIGSYIKSLNHLGSSRLRIVNTEILELEAKIHLKEVQHMRRLTRLGWLNKWVGLSKIRFFT